MLDKIFDLLWPYKAPNEIDLSRLSEDHKEYIISRVNDQINWYDKKSIRAQKSISYSLFLPFYVPHYLQLQQI